MAETGDRNQAQGTAEGSGAAVNHNRQPSDSRRPLTLMGWIREIIAIPIRFFIWSCRDFFTLIASFFGGPLTPVAEPREEVRQFVAEFRGKYDADELLPWLNMPYADAMSEARRSMKFVLFYLHNPTSPDSDEFCHNYLMSEPFLDFILVNEALLWGVSVRSNEGRKLAALAPPGGAPFIGLLRPDKGRDICIERLSYPFTLADMSERLTNAAHYNRHVLDELRRERQELDQANALRREQDREYQEALERDRARVAERKRVESERAEAELLARQEEERQLQKLDDLKTRRQRIAASMGSAPESGVKIQVRFPNGTSFARHFNPEDSLEVLFNAVLIQESCPNDFSLISSYPRVALKCAPHWYSEFTKAYEHVEILPTLREAGLVGSTTILVKDNDA